MTPAWHFVNGVPNISSIRLGNGSAAAPSLALAGPTTGWYGEGTDSVRAAIQGALRWSIGGQGITGVTDGNFLELGLTGPVRLTHSASRLTLSTGDAFNLAPTAFASLPTGSEGDLACVTDSNTATWGATIAGGGANNVLAYFNGTNWTVAGA